MNQGTKIEWTHHEGFKGETWNPITGCSKVSPGCANCYADRDWNRLAGNPKLNSYSGRKFTDVAFHPERLEQPLRWNKPRSVFVNSMSDLFHEAVTFEQIAAIFGIMAATPQHRYMILTKRPERMLEFFQTLKNESLGDIPDILGREYYRYTKLGPGETPFWPLSNVWLGVTAENQEQADKRIPLLLQAPASKRFVSIEPMLGPIEDLYLYLPNIYTDSEQRYHKCNVCGQIFCGNGAWTDEFFGTPCPNCHFHGSPNFQGCGDWEEDEEELDYDWFMREGDTEPIFLDWVIVGGESGPKARPMLPDWVRSIRDQCKEAETPFFFKQWGEFVDYQQADAQAQHSISFKSAPAHGDEVVLFRVGKKQAGFLLDGEEYKEIPGKQPVEKTKL